MDRCNNHESHEMKFEKLIDNMDNMRERITINSESTKASHHRIDNIEKQTDAIIEMTTSVKMLAMQVKDMLEVMKSHSERLDTLEKAPSIKIMGYAQIVAGTFLAGITGYLLALLFENR